MWKPEPKQVLNGFWIFKAEQDDGFITDQFKVLDCKTNGLLTSMTDSVKPMWKSAYVAYKRAAASLSCYIHESWEKLMMPYLHISEWLSLKLSTLSNSSLGFIFTVWTTLWQGLYDLMSLLRNTFYNINLFIYEFLKDSVGAVANLLYFIGRFFTDCFLIISDSFLKALDSVWSTLKSAILNLKSYLYLLFYSPKEKAQVEQLIPQGCSIEGKNLAKFKSEMEDVRSFSGDLSAIKKKIDDLELAFRMEKESSKTRTDFYDQKLKENHLALQKYQASVNKALMSSKRPGPISSSTMQYFLDNHSDGLKQWITQNFLMKSESPNIDENQIALLMAKYSNKTGEELLALKEHFRLFIINHKNELESLRKDFSVVSSNAVGNGDVSIAFIKKLVGDAIKLYDADKTGKVDYALETSGGQVVSIRCTDTYVASPKSYVLFGWSVYSKTSSPRDAINPGMAPGQCWAFVGSQGFLVLQLSHTIRVTGFTMEHVSKSLVPRGHIESAPKNFSMRGLKSEHDANPYLFGNYMYLDNGETLQYFPVLHPTSEHYNMVELEILSNHGNPNYTCLYRIRVHGEMDQVGLPNQV